MKHTPRGEAQLDALAAHLQTNRASILRQWREAAESDLELTTSSSLSRVQFHDHIPEVLDAFHRKLCAHQRSEIAEATEDQKESASGHGLQRWQQGYREREVMREWRHLHLCLVDELERYASDHPNLERSVLPAARRALAELCSDGVCESAGQYARLQRAEAAGRVRDLEFALAELSELGKRRAQAWHEAAHDLRGSFTVVKNVSKFLTDEDLSPTERARFAATLQRGVTSLHALLNDLLGLARLEAGQEQREVAPFDAAVLLEEICENMRHSAKERGLFFEAEGPPTLEVEGDRVKTHRLVQNLVINALKYTEHGGVRVTWERSPEVERWVLCVQDTGPGLRASGAPPIAYALAEATKQVQSLHAVAEKSEPSVSEDTHAPTLRSQSSYRPPADVPGEGIGLSIVKRLCELLDASLELETQSGKGTTFRVIFPSRLEGTSGAEGGGSASV
ncbi:MAG TPA: sensor histidine kinase [Myxococcota bacterium]|nr:sensor histidine kinase [Myxococcota bacterium]